MSNSISLYSELPQMIQEGQLALIENIKLLLYKNNPNIFDVIDFNNDVIYQEPLLFAYFNQEINDALLLDSILFGYIDFEKRPNQIQAKSDQYGRIYLPKIGWFSTSVENQIIDLVSDKNGHYSLKKNNKRVNFKFEPIKYIANSSIELAIYPIQILDKYYYNSNRELIKVDIESITKIQRENLEAALLTIRNTAPHYYSILNNIIKKIVIFKVDATLRNSFAHIGAHGTGFFNAFQDEYNEVFFIDDIAHQCGHVIFNTLIFEPNRLLKVSSETIVKTIQLENNEVENTNIFVLFHALFTYYVTFICLDSYLSIDSINSEKRHEALGRLKFYVGKCYQDLILIDESIESSTNAKKMFNDKGLLIFNEIKKTWKLIVNKWQPEIKDFDMSNQPYNFSFLNLLEKNPLK
ncbi:MAG: hypothetical protein ACJARP_001890 [Vicingaceae bacterium]|jgi:hypothetical protein